jgi:hypothetical protein
VEGRESLSRPEPGRIVDSMVTESGDILREDLAARARAIVAELQSAVQSGAYWYPALLDAIARWPLPLELVDGRCYRYLIGGEAFDWLLLAERLLQSIERLVPEEERMALLFHARPPIEQSTDDFRAAIGESKYRAHLNYVYGVVVEEALQLSVEEDVHKELRCCAWGQDRRVDESVYHRIYGRPREDLFAAFREERGIERSDEILLGDLREFTYWLFRYRMRQCDGARVASDTRRGLVQLSHMQARHHALIPDPEPIEPQSTFEGRAAARA